MKKLLTFLIFLSGYFHAASQINIDSLNSRLQQTQVSRENLQHSIRILQNVSPSNQEAAVLVFNWIDRNTNSDSLFDIKAAAHFAIGRMYTHQSLFAKASFHLTQAQSIAEQKNYPVILAQSLNALGSIYQANGQHKIAMSYYERSIATAKEDSYMQGISKASFNLGTLELTIGGRSIPSKRKALQLMLTAYNITSSLRDTQSVITQATGIADVYTSMKNYDSALFYLRLAGFYIRDTQNERAHINHYQAIARVFGSKKEYDDAIESYKKGLDLAQKYNSPRWMCQFYDGMATVYESKGDYKMANFYNQKNIKMHNTLVSQENFVAAADIQNRYERAKKDNEILQLSLENKQKELLNKVLIGSLLASVVIGVLGFAYFKKSRQVLKQQKDIHERKISELEKNKQLLAIDAMLKGQEEERSRIAKELHDGLGGLLSGIRLSLVNMREALSLTPEGYEKFNRPLSMLDNTINDLRKLAHNLMPEALVKYGLHDALKDFCNSIQSTTGIQITYQQFGQQRQLNNTATVFIYRIVQELVNNVMKHAAATEIMIQLAQNNNATIITVEDNGKGFDKKMVLDHSTGAGMKNIQYRVQYLNGSFDIATSPGHGTSVSIIVKA